MDGLVGRRAPREDHAAVPGDAGPQGGAGQAARVDPLLCNGSGRKDAQDEGTGEAVVALFFMIAAAPFLSHATVRALRVSDDGDWRGPAPAPAPGPGRPAPGQRPPGKDAAPGEASQS